MYDKNELFDNLRTSQDLIPGGVDVENVALYKDCSSCFMMAHELIF